MFCGKCGNELAEGTKFCPKCGSCAEIVENEQIKNEVGKRSVKRAYL